jgi:DHA1 family inner membrane transport protein
MTIGNFLGGRLADRGALRAIFISFGVLVVALLVVALTASTTPGLFVGLFGVGVGAACLSPAIQTRLMDVAGDSQTLAAAVNHSSLNLGNSLGAFLGGIVIAASWGYIAPTWIGLALCFPGILLAVLGGLITHGEAKHRLSAVDEIEITPVGG